MLRRALALCLTLLVLAACSRPWNSEQEQDTVPPEPVSLTILETYGLMDRQALDGVIRLFQDRYPHVSVVVDAGGGNLYTNGQFDPERLSGVDIFWGALDDNLVKAGLALDLSHLPLPEWDPLVSPFMDAYNVRDGKRLYVPVQVDIRQLTLFKPMFEEAGVPLPEANWTYEDLIRLGKELMSADQQLALSLSEFLQPTLHAYGVRLYDPATDRWTVNTAETRAALTMLRRLVEEGIIQERLGTVSVRTGPPGHNRGPAIRGHWSLPIDSTQQRFPLPKGPAGRGTGAKFLGPVVISTTPHPEEAVAFVQLLLTEEAQTVYAQQGHRPFVGYPGALEAWRNQVGAETAHLVEEALAGVITDFWWSNYEEIVASLYQFLRGEVELDEVLPDLEARLNR